MNRLKQTYILNYGILLLTTLGLVSCAPVGPNYHRPDIKLPDHWTEPTAADVNQPGSTIALGTWWQTFGDPVLTGLVHDARQNNPDLHAAVARLREARALQGVVASQGDLNVDTTGNYTRRRESLTGAQGPVVQRGFMPRDYDLYQAGFDASWELDLFGRVRRSKEAAAAETAARLANLRDVQVSLEAEVAAQYVALRLAQQQQILTKRLLVLQKNTRDIVQQKHAHGLATQQQVDQINVQVQATSARLPVLHQAERAHCYRLAVLLACAPADMVKRLGRGGDIPDTNSPTPGSIPADLLRRRPDIRQAERELAAATARIGVARADLYPRLTLNGTLGWSTLDLGSLRADDSVFAGLGPGFRWPLLNGVRLKHQVQAADARTDAALAAYRKTVYLALGDVETALNAFREDTRHWQAIKQQYATQRHSVTLSRQLQNQGLLDKPGLNAAEASLLATDKDLLAARAQRTTALIQLFKAMGGGWEESPQKP